jgi:hypothetical protein
MAWYVAGTVNRIAPEHAAQVDRVLAKHERYLKRLSIRLKELGVTHPECLPGWVEKAEWATSGLRHHFAKWASGRGSHGYPPAKS